jgi:RNA polymerase sigma-70 factor (ECF subfamily)
MPEMSRRENDEPGLSDLDLIRRCAKGEVRAQELLYRRWFSFAMSVCIRYAKDEYEAMEIVNDSFMKVLGNTHQYDGSKPFRSWYGKILVNTAVDNYRRNAKNKTNISISDVETTREIEPEVHAELSAREILLLFNQIPENYRVTFNLFEIEGYSHEEIGQMLGVGSSTSRSNLARAKKMLRELYRRNFNTGGNNNEEI